MNHKQINFLYRSIAGLVLLCAAAGAYGGYQIEALSFAGLALGALLGAGTASVILYSLFFFWGLAVYVFTGRNIFF